MVACPKSGGQEQNGAEAKHNIIKQLAIGPYRPMETILNSS